MAQYRVNDHPYHAPQFTKGRLENNQNLRYIFHLNPGRYIAVFTAAPKSKPGPDCEPTEFMLRCVGDNIEVNHLEDRD